MDVRQDLVLTTDSSEAFGGGTFGQYSSSFQSVVESTGLMGNRLRDSNCKVEQCLRAISL